MEAILSPTEPLPTSFHPSRGDLRDALAPLDDLARRSDYLIKRDLGSFRHGAAEYRLPRYLFLGPSGGGEVIRLGLFASIHGDEPQGALALTRLAQRLQAEPELAKGYALFLYPICNPTGFEDGTRSSRSGKDLNREFWRNSTEPEVKWLETEIWTHAFHGLINLHADDTSAGFYGFVHGEVLSEYLLEPALKAAESFIPRNRGARIDGFPAQDGVIRECYEGVLRAPAGLAQAPFALTLETPHHEPVEAQVKALEAALRTILVEYRSVVSIAQNI